YPHRLEGSLHRQLRCRIAGFHPRGGKGNGVRTELLGRLRGRHHLRRLRGRAGEGRGGRRNRASHPSRPLSVRSFMRFAINHITAPKLSLEAFFATARELGLTEVEIRNDLPDVVGTVEPAAVKSAAEKAGVTIISINALYPFNVW